MSGGHWDYSGFRIQMALEDIAEDEEVKKRFPNLAKALDLLGDALYDMEHELDYDLSSDSHIEDDEKWEKDMLLRLEYTLVGCAS